MDMMGNMSLGDAMSGEGANPSHNGAKITHKLTIHSSQSTTRESELRSTVVRKQRVCVLKESNQDKPMVDPERNDQPR